MSNVEANDIINGLYGFVYDENGVEQATTQEFEAILELDKQGFKLPGQFMEKNKIMGGKGKGSWKQLKIDSILQKKLLETPTLKFNYIGKLADPTARGEEAVLLKGISFDKVPIMKFKMGEQVELDLDFTFDEASYISDIT